MMMVERFYDIPCLDSSLKVGKIFNKVMASVDDMRTISQSGYIGGEAFRES